MKRSRAITLTLIASVSISLQACDSEVDTKREVYRTKQACLEDWGTEAECEEDRQSGRYNGPHYIYHGSYPYYYRRGNPEPVPVPAHAGFSKVPEGGRSLHSTGSFSSAHVSRGGFGGSAHGHGSWS